MLTPGLVSVTFKKESPEFVLAAMRRAGDTAAQLAEDADSLRSLLRAQGLLQEG